MGIKIELRDYCYDCDRSDLVVDTDTLRSGRIQKIYCSRASFCDALITRLKLDRLEKSVDELKEREK